MTKVYRITPGIMEIMEAMHTIRHYAIVSREITSEMEWEYKHLTYRLASNLEEYIGGDEELKGLALRILENMHNDSLLEEYDPLQDGIVNKQFISDLTKLLLYFDRSAIADPNRKHHLFQALKYLDLYKADDEKQQRIMLTIQPCNGGLDTSLVINRHNLEDYLLNPHKYDIKQLHYGNRFTVVEDLRGTTNVSDIRVHIEHRRLMSILNGFIIYRAILNMSQTSCITDFKEFVVEVGGPNYNVIYEFNRLEDSGCNEFGLLLELFLNYDKKIVKGLLTEDIYLPNVHNVRSDPVYEKGKYELYTKYSEDIDTLKKSCHGNNTASSTIWIRSHILPFYKNILVYTEDGAIELYVTEKHLSMIEGDYKGNLKKLSPLYARRAVVSNGKIEEDNEHMNIAEK